MRALISVGNVIVYPFSAFALKRSVLTGIYRQREKGSDPTETSPVPKYSFMHHYFTGPKNERESYKIKLNKAQENLKKELDMARFVKRMRLAMLTTWSKLSMRQSLLAERVALPAVHSESSISSDGNHKNMDINRVHPDPTILLASLENSQDIVDARLMRIMDFSC